MSKSAMPTAVHLLFIRGDKILMLRRAHTGYQDGNYSLVAGHHEDGESLTHTAVREAKEEAGVDIEPQNLSLKVLVHKKEADERIAVFFAVHHWSGEIQNMEPDKCDDLSWFALDNLPSNTIPYIRAALDALRNNKIYVEFGW